MINATLLKNGKKPFKVTMYDYLRAQMETKLTPFKTIATGDKSTCIAFGTDEHSYNITISMSEHHVGPYIQAFKIKKVGDMSEITDLNDEQTQIVSSDILK